MLSSLHLFLKVTSVTPEAEATSNCLLCSSLRINDKYKIAPANPIGSFLPQFHLLLNRAYNLQHVFLYSRLSPFYLQSLQYTLLDLLLELLNLDSKLFVYMLLRSLCMIHC